MLRRFQPPMFVLAGGLLGLIALLATLQYRWLGQISEAERERMGATLTANASAFAEDFDRELNRAYLLFQMAPAGTGDTVASQVSSRYDQWQATSRFPRMIKDVYVATPVAGEVTIQRFDAASRFVVPAEWPAALDGVRAALVAGAKRQSEVAATAMIHSAVPTVWPDVPALVTSAPLVFFSHGPNLERGPDLEKDRLASAQLSYAVLLLDAGYIRSEMLPSLAQHHFQSPAGGSDYELAVVPTGGGGSLYHSVAEFNPEANARVDASADFFNLRVQDFGPLAAEISRFAVFSTAGGAWTAGRGGDGAAQRQTMIRQTFTTSGTTSGTASPTRSPLSIIVQQTGPEGLSATISGKPLTSDTATTTNARFSVVTGPHWRLLVKHPSGSLEQAVNSVRRRNLFVSTGILGILGVSVGLLVVSTRRAHDLARQQLEFVATVSHELRTPLAVIRSAADNLADGVIGDEARVRQYGQLVRREGLRLTDLVEQILEFAGLQSGQRAVARHPVTLDAVIRDAAAASLPVAEAAGVRIELAIADRLPQVAGDEAALRRVFVNLIGNAVKYGAAAGWVGVRVTSAGGALHAAISDKGIGIEPAEQSRIFEPFYRTPGVVAAQIQGAGLGLSLVKRIVEAHGGDVAVTSAPGHGSTFTVTLPAMTGDPAPRRDSVGDAATQYP